MSSVACTDLCNALARNRITPDTATIALCPCGMPQESSQPHALAPKVDTLRDLGLGSAIKCSHHSIDVQKVQLSNVRLPPHLSSTLWLEADRVSGNHIEWANKTFWEMRLRGRWLVGKGLDAATIMGDTCPSLSSSGQPHHAEDDGKFWTVSRWAARFVDNFLHLNHSDRLACWIVMFVTFHVRRLSYDVSR